MLGNSPISTRAISSGGVLAFNTAALSFAFDQSSNAIFIGTSSSSMTGTATKVTAGVGVLGGISSISFAFDKTTSGKLVASGVSSQSATFNQTTEGGLTAAGVSSQSVTFTQSTAGLR